jgi:hypothetical protein
MEQSKRYITRQLGIDEKWDVINQAIWEVIARKPEKAFMLSDIETIVSTHSCDSDEVLTVLALLDCPKENFLEMKYFRRNSDSREEEISLEEVNRQIRAWWKEKSLTEGDWQNWASDIFVKWSPVSKGEDI